MKLYVAIEKKPSRFVIDGKIQESYFTSTARENLDELLRLYSKENHWIKEIEIEDESA